MNPLEATPGQAAHKAWGDLIHAWRNEIKHPVSMVAEGTGMTAERLRALEAAGPDVASCVEGAYPDLGKTVYSPAGDPREGPTLAKSYMSPHPAGMDQPQKGAEMMTTRMLSDPDDRAKEKSSRLADVMQVLRGMEQAAADADVDPEGMFLNTYRDMHREKIRYS